MWKCGGWTVDKVELLGERKLTAAEDDETRLKLGKLNFMNPDNQTEAKKGLDQSGNSGVEDYDYLCDITRNFHTLLALVYMQARVLRHRNAGRNPG
jgi:hypothetical protein